MIFSFAVGLSDAGIRHMFKRVILLILYWASSIIVSLFFMGSGDGWYAPADLLASWATVVWFKVRILEGLPYFYILFLVYLLSIFLINTVFARNVRLAVLSIRAMRCKGPIPTSGIGQLDLPIIPLIIHLSGSIFALSEYKSFRIFPDVEFDKGALIFGAMSYAISFLMTILYLALDWRLAKKSTC
jgi:hypothetical protein